MPLFGILLVVATIFVAFVIVLAWGEWKKRNHPFVHDSGQGKILDASPPISVKGNPPAAELSHGARVQSSRSLKEFDKAGLSGPSADPEMTPQQNPTPHEGTAGSGSQAAVTALRDPHKENSATDGSLKSPRTTGTYPPEAGRMNHADVGQRSFTHLVTTESRQQEFGCNGERLSAKAKERAETAWPRFHYQTPAISQQTASAEVRASEQLRATIEEMMPALQLEVAKSLDRVREDLVERLAKQFEGPTDEILKIPDTRGDAGFKGSVKAAKDRISDIYPYSPQPSSQDYKSRPNQENNLPPRVVESTPYIRTIELGSKAPTQSPPRARSEVAERILVLALWWIMVPAALLFAFYPSKSIVTRLQPEPPAEFFYDQQRWSAKQQAAEENLARAYWASAVRSIQFQYASDKELPADPPPEFKIEQEGSEGKTLRSNSATRTRYWDKLRQVWEKPDIWDKAYVRNPSLFSDLWASMQQWIRKYTHEL